MDPILDFLDRNALKPEHAGGKGVNLARLTQAGLPVPPGIIFTTVVYDDLVRSLPPRARRAMDAPGSQAELAHLRAAICRAPFSRALAARIKARLNALLTAGPVAVRSSATCEDLAEAAFAGQHLTELNVTTADDALAALKRCFASLWEERAVLYRREAGFGAAEPKMAVVVQQMLRSEAAGVYFSVNPVTSDLAQAMVNSAFGLGELVVSGEGEVDQFVLDYQSGCVIRQRIGRKTHAIVAQAAGTARSRLSGKSQSRASLTPSQLAELHSLCRRIDQLFRYPQDIEWALCSGSFHILQARPVTCLKDRWTRDESAERFPNAVTPLSWDFTADGFHASLAYSLRLLGLPQLKTRWFSVFDDHVYGNQTAVDLLKRASVTHFTSLDDLRVKLPEARPLYRRIQELPVAWARDLDRYLLRLGALKVDCLPQRSDAGLLKHLQELEHCGREYFMPNIAISLTHGMLHHTLLALVRLTAKPERAADLYHELTSYCETKTSLINRELYALAGTARRTPGLLKLLRTRGARAICSERLLARFPEFDAAFARFVEDHGHREVDWDPSVPTWRAQPWVVLDTILALLSAEGSEQPLSEEEQRLRQHNAEKEYLQGLPSDLRFFAEELLRLARMYTALDDLEHYHTSRMNELFRRAVIEIGERLVLRGIIAEPEDAFFLSRSTLEGALSGEVPDALPRLEAREQKARYLANRAKAPAWELGAAERRPVRGKKLPGLPGSPGCVQGPVFRVKTLDDFQRFPKGAVLAAATTNPSWTPLFYNACAVITESGGPLSHGAVTARELGLPAVMAVRHAMQLLQDGMQVRVDGTAGVVEIICGANGKDAGGGSKQGRSRARRVNAQSGNRAPAASDAAARPAPRRRFHAL